MGSRDRSSLTPLIVYVKVLNMVRKITDILVYASSILGLIACIYLAVVEVISFSEELSGFSALVARVSMFGLIPVSILLIFRLQAINYDKTQRQVDEAGISGCPTWVRALANVLLIVGAILFFLPMFLELFHYLPHNDGEFFPATVSGGFGILAYSSIFVQLYSANALANTLARENE